MVVKTETLLSGSESAEPPLIVATLAWSPAVNAVAVSTIDPEALMGRLPSVQVMVLPDVHAGAE